MKRVMTKKRGAEYIRILRTTDLDRLGIKHKGENLVWNRENNFTLEMSNQMSDSLVEKLPNDFIVSDADGEDEVPEVKDPMTSLASSAGLAEGSPDESVESADDQAQGSTRPKSKNR